MKSRPGGSPHLPLTDPGEVCFSCILDALASRCGAGKRQGETGSSRIPSCFWRAGGSQASSQAPPEEPPAPSPSPFHPLRILGNKLLLWSRCCVCQGEPITAEQCRISSQSVVHNLSSVGNLIAFLHPSPGRVLSVELYLSRRAGVSQHHNITGC